MGGRPARMEGLAVTGITPETRARARQLRRDMTPQERRLWRVLRELNQRIGTHFRRQAPVGRFIADFADLGRRLVIEVDGGQHGGPGDAARDRWFALQGFRVLRVWNSDVDRNPDGVVQAVLDALAAARPSLADNPAALADMPPPPSPPHKGEGRHGSQGAALADRKDQP